MYRFVQKLQKKDDRQKRVLLVLMTAASALLVGGAWLFMLKGKLSGSEAFVGPSFQVREQEEKEEKVSIDVERPFQSLKDTTVSSFAAIKGQFNNLTKELSERSSEDDVLQKGENSEAFLLPTDTQ